MNGGAFFWKAVGRIGDRCPGSLHWVSCKGVLSSGAQAKEGFFDILVVNEKIF